MTNGTDVEQLSLLSVFHYVLGGIMALFSLVPLIHLAVGIAFVTGALDDMDSSSPPPPIIGWFFIGFASMFICLGLTIAVCMLIAARKLARHTSYTYCLVIAGVECIFMPLGTILGVFTIVVLMRPSVKLLFEAGKNPKWHGGPPP